LKTIFLPRTARNPPCSRVLILDNQGSHITTDFLWECRQANIRLVFLIPHISHACQPLDMCPFSIIKAKYRENVHKLAQFDDAAKIKKQHFLRMYNEARI
jgi:DDE superfamily endonuclease